MSEPLMSPGGPLIPKHKSPACALCGRRLWKAHTYDDYRPELTRFDEATGHRLGYVPAFRDGEDGKPVCWNSKACAKRRKDTPDEQP